jgi:predicted dehydrogenase
VNANAGAGVTGVGVIGCGRATVALHLPALSRLPGLRVTALCDSNAARLTEVGRAWGVASLYRDHGELLGDPTVQVVLIAVPTPEHHDVFLRAIEAGKHIYVEKPVALNLAQADRMLTAAATSRGQTVLGFNLRSHRLVRSARACIRSGALGRVVALRTVLVGGLSERVPWQHRRAEGGGAIYELGSHHFDLWRFLLDSEAVDVRAHSLSNGSDDSTVAVSGRLSSGTLASSILALSGTATHQVEVIGQAATLRFSLYRADSFHIEPVGRLSELIRWLGRLPDAVRAARRGGDYLDSYRAHWMRFLEALAGGDPPATVKDGRESLRIALGAFESESSGRRCTL